MELVRSRSYDLNELVDIVLKPSKDSRYKRIDLTLEQMSEPFLYVFFN